MIDFIQQILCKFFFDKKCRIRTWKKISMQIRYGLTIKESIQALHRQAKDRNRYLAEVFELVLARLGSAHPLGTAITGFASPEEIMLITSGQKAGRLPESLLLAAELLEQRRKISKAVVLALAYPLFLTFSAVAMLATVAIYVMPNIASYSDPSQWTGNARVFYLICSFVGSWAGLVFGLVIISCVCLIIFSLPRLIGYWRLCVDSYAPWSFYRLSVGGVWLFTLATLMRSGMQISEILSTMLSSDIVSPYLHERIKAINEQVGRGENIGEALFKCGYNFPDKELVDDFRVYATLPFFKEQLQSMAQGWMDEGIELIQMKARVFNMVFLVIIIMQMIMITLSVMDIQSQINAQTMGGMR